MPTKYKHNEISVGKVLKITLLLVVGKLRKVLIFNGLCIAKSKKHNSFFIRNIFNTEIIELKLLTHCPFIINLLSYNPSFTIFKKRHKMYFKKLVFIKTVLNKKKTQKTQLNKLKNPLNYYLAKNYKNTLLRKIRNKYRLKKVSSLEI